MSFAGNTRNDAVRAAVTNAELQVAINLKRSWTRIRLASASLVPPRTLPENPTDEDFQRMALELIDTRQLTIGGQTLELSELDNAPSLQGIRAQLSAGSAGGTLTSFQQMVPTRNQINLVANSIGDGVYENTGNIGFLRGATIGSALMGLFQWIFSGFRGGFQGLFDTIAGNTAGNMRQSVTNNLTRLRHRLQGTPDDISFFMTDTAITGVGNTLHSTVLHRANPNTPAPLSETLAGVRIGDLDPILHTQVQARVRTEIRRGIILGMSNPDNPSSPFRDLAAVLRPDGTEASAPGFMGRSWETVQNLVTSNTNYFGLGPRQRYEAANNVANAVSDRLSTIIANPNYRYPPAGVTPPPHLATLAARNLSLAQMSASDRAAVLAEEANLAVQTLANTARQQGNVPLANFYVLMNTELPAQMQTRLANDTQLAAVINALGSPNVNAPSLAGAAPDRLARLLPQTLTDRRSVLVTVLTDSLGGNSADAQQFRRIALGNSSATLTSAQYGVLADRMNAAIEYIKTHASEIPASGPARYARIAEIMRNNLSSPEAVAAMNGAGLRVTSQVMDVMSDQITMQMLGTPPNFATSPEFADFRADVARRLNAATASAIGGMVQAGLRAQSAELNLAAGGELLDAHYDAISSQVSPILAEYAEHPERLAALGNNAHTEISRRIREALIAHRDQINAAGLPDNEQMLDFSDEALASMADSMAVEGIQGIVQAGASANAARRPPLVMPSITPPPAFVTASNDRRIDALKVILLRKLHEDETTALLAEIGTLPAPVPPATRTVIAANDPAFQTIADAAAPAIVDISNRLGEYRVGTDNPPRYNAQIYQDLARDIRANLPDGITNATGLSLSSAALDALADQMAVQAIQGQLGNRAPAIAPDSAFATQMTTHRRAVVQEKVLTSLQSTDSLKVLRVLSGLTGPNPPAMTATHPAIARIAEVTAPVMERQVSTEAAKAAVREQRADAYLALARDFQTALDNGNINVGGANFNANGRRFLALQMAAQAVETAHAPGQAPARPQAFQDELERLATPVISAGLVDLVRTNPDIIPAVRAATGIQTLTADHAAIPVFATSIAPAIAPLITNPNNQWRIAGSNPPAYRPEIYQQLSARILTEIQKPENRAALVAAGVTLTPAVEASLADRMAVMIVEQQIPQASRPAQPQAFITQRNTNERAAIERVAQARIVAAMSVTEQHNGAAVPVLLNAMSLANHNGTGFVSVNPTTVATTATGVLRTHMFVGDTAQLASRPATLADQRALVATIEGQLSTALGGAPNSLQPRLRTQLAHALAVEFVRNMPAADGVPQIPAEPLTPTQIVTNAISNDVEGARTLVRTSLATAGSTVLAVNPATSVLPAPVRTAAANLAASAVSSDNLFNFTNASSTISGAMLAEIRSPGWATMTPAQRDSSLSAGLNTALLRDYSSIFPGGLDITIGGGNVTVGGGMVPNPVYAVWAAVPFNPLPRPPLLIANPIPARVVPIPAIWSGFIDLTPPTYKPIIVAPISNFLMNRIRGASQQTSALPQRNQDGAQFAMADGNLGDLGGMPLVTTLPAGQPRSRNPLLGNGGGVGGIA